MIEQYLAEFGRWTAGGKVRKQQLQNELEAHLRAAEQAGDLEATLQRLGPPKEAAKTFGRGYEPPPAHIGRRIGAFLIDVAASVALVLASLGLATWSFGLGDDTAAYLPLKILSVAIVVPAFAWWPIALTLSEWRYGKTPGKALLGLEVITEDGTAPAFGQIVLRRLTLVFSGPLQIIDWGFALFNDRRQRGLDKLAGTVVVKANNSAHATAGAELQTA